MKTIRYRPNQILAMAGVISGVATIAPPALAVDFSAAVGAEAAYSTNSDRAPMDEVQQWIFSPSLDVGVTHESRALEWESAYSYQRRIYQQDRFDDENALTGTTELQWNAVPERLILNLEHFQTESTIDSIRSNTPDNRQESSSASGSLTYQQPTIGRQYLSFTGTYTDQSFEETDNDSETTEVEVAYAIPLNEVRGYEVFASESSTEFDSFSSAGYDSRKGGVRFYSATPSGSLQIEAGYTETDPDGIADETSGVTGSIDLQRGINAPFQWGILASRNISDRSGQLDRGTIDFFDEGELLDTGSTNVFIETIFRLSVASRVGPNLFRAAVNTADNDYENATLDTETRTVSLGLDRNVSENTQLELELSVSEQEFDVTDRSDDLYIGRLSFSWDRTSRLQLSSSIAYQERDSDSAQASFKEWIGTVSVTYVLAE